MTESLIIQLDQQHDGFSLSVDLVLPNQGVTAIFGPSGSGKTTLLRALAGLDAASGHIKVNGDTWLDGGKVVPCHERRVGYVFQEASLLSHLSVAGNLAYARKRAVTPLSAEEESAIIDLLGISARMDNKPAQLSGGERQRVAIARALISGPQLLLMDEPLASLDDKRKADILPFLQRLKETTSIPVIYVSHSQQEVARLADHLVLLNQGKVVASGPVQETLADLHLANNPLQAPFVVLDGKIEAQFDQWHMVTVAVDGMQLWMRDAGLDVGHPVRLQVMARDVSISLSQAHDSSIQNVLPGKVVELVDQTDSALVKCQVADQIILAQLTLRALEQLQLVEGMRCWVQVKSVALI